MTISKVRDTITKAITVGSLAVALILAAPLKAEAQHFSFGVDVGAPYYDRHDDFERRRYEEQCREQAFARQQAFAQHQAWEQHERSEAWEQHERHEAWEHRGFGDRHDQRYDGYGR